MTATYSSIDTLSVGSCESSGPISSGSLPVLAEIPNLGSSRPQPVKQTNNPLPTPVPIAKPETREPSEPPAPPVQEAQSTIDVPSPKLVAEESWDQEHWSARLLEVESAIRPHARMIALVALIVLTGVTLAVMRAPAKVAVEAPPTEVVDAPHSAPEIGSGAEAEQLVNTAPLWNPPVQPPELEPIPSLPAASQQIASSMPTARVTAVGPVPGAGTPEMTAEPITPVETSAKPAQQGETIASSSGPAVSPSVVRTAARPSYPTTQAPINAWSPDRGAAADTKPVAELITPTRTY